MPRGRPRKRAPDVAMTPEQARLILAQWEREDPLNHYLNHFAGPIGLSFLKTEAIFCCIEAANRAGKSTLMQYDCVAKLRGKHPFRKNFVRRILVIITRTDQAATVWGDRLLKRSKLPKVQVDGEWFEIGKHPWIPAREIRKVHNRPSQKYGPYPGRIDMKNGSELFMALAGDPDSWLGLEGLEFDDIYRDEASGTENLSDELDARLWTTQSDPDKAGGGGITWGFTETKDNEESRKFRKRCQDGVTKHAYFFLPNSENKSVSDEVRAGARERMSKEAYQTRALGQGSLVDRIKIYAPYWDPARHERSEPYEIASDDNLWLTFDPGWRDKCGILCTAVNKAAPRRIRVVRWMSYKFGGYEKAILDMLDWLDGRTAVTVICDMAMRGSKQDTGESYFAVFQRLLGEHKLKLYREPCFGQNRLESGHPRVQALLQNADNPGDWSIEVDMNGQGCQSFVDELNNYRWAQDREGNLLKTPRQKNIEAADTTKYLTSRVLPWDPDWACGAPLSTPEAPSDPLGHLSSEERLHQRRLQASADLADDLQGRSGGIGLGVGMTLTY